MKHRRAILLFWCPAGCKTFIELILLVHMGCFSRQNLIEVHQHRLPMGALANLQAKALQISVILGFAFVDWFESSTTSGCLTNYVTNHHTTWLNSCATSTYLFVSKLFTYVCIEQPGTVTASKHKRNRPQNISWHVPKRIQMFNLPHFSGFCLQEILCFALRTCI